MFKIENDKMNKFNNIKFVPDFDKANVKQMLNDILVYLKHIVLH